MSLLDKIAAYIQRTDELNRMHLEIGRLLEKNRTLEYQLRVTEEGLRLTEQRVLSQQDLLRRLEASQVDPEMVEAARAMRTMKKFLRT